MPKLPTKAAAKKAAPPGKDTPMEGLSEFAPGSEGAGGTDTPPADVSPPAATRKAVKKAPAKAATRKPPTRPDPPADEAGTWGAGDMGLGFANLDETSEHVNVLLYGREGTTKTTALALASQVCPDNSRILIVNAEGGLKVTALRRRGVNTSKIQVWPAPNSGVRITYQTLLDLHEQLQAQLMDDPHRWFMVGIDSISDVVEELRGQATTKRIDRAMRNPQVADKSLIDPDFVDRADYGVMTNQLRDWLRDMRDLPCHLVITALERYDEETKMTGPAISPALANSVMGYVDIAAYMRATLHAPGEDDDRSTLAEVRALTRPGKATRAKERFDLLPRVLAEPTFPRILSYVREELTEENDPIQAAYVERRAAELAQQEAEKAERAAAKAAKKAPAKKAAKPAA